MRVAVPRSGPGHARAALGGAGHSGHDKGLEARLSRTLSASRSATPFRVSLTSCSTSPPSAPLPPLPLSQVYADLDLAAQGFTALPISTSIVDMDLTWQKYGLNFCSPSLGRAMSR